ncbi:MAG: hypothetical protein ABSH52_31315 [Terriglobia bacterium]
MSTAFSPVFDLYNQALTDQEQKRTFEGTNAEGETKQFDDADDATAFDEYGGCTLVESQALEQARNAAKPHFKAIKAKLKSIPANQPGAQTWQLDDKYRMECIDVKHRMGDYLGAAYDEFKGTHVKNANFWEWVTAQSADDQKVKSWNPALFAAAQQKGRPEWEQFYLRWFRKGVKYLADDHTRERYWVEIHGGIMKRRLRSKDQERTPFDTKELIDKVKEKYPDMGFLCIWVLSTKDQFYSHVGKIGRFHHSSLLAGTEVKSAGEWGVGHGKLKWINGKSGHYKPELARFVESIELLSPSGVVPDDAVVRLYAPPAPAVVQSVKVAEFLTNVKRDAQFYTRQGHEVYY